jgi:hypothetical protein
LNTNITMYVHLYKVARTEGAPPLEDTLTEIGKLSHENRLQSIGFQTLRLDDELPPDLNSPFWKLDFCKFRSKGPGRASRSTPTTSFQLGHDERFSEETAVVYSPAAGYLALQYNHYGPRAAAIAQYLSQFLPDGMEYTFELQLDPAAQARLEKKTLFTKVQYRVAPAELSAAWKANNVSMAKAINVQQQTYGGDWLTMEVSLERDSPQSLSVKDKIKGFFGLASEGPKAVKNLKVAGRDDSGSCIDIVDLLKEKLEKSYKNMPLDTGLRVAASDRWIRIASALSDWAKQGVIK